MNKKTIIVSIVLVIAIVLGFVYKLSNGVSVTAGTSPTGATFNDAKLALIVMAPATGTATSSSVLNNTSNDWYVTSIKAGCEKLGTSFTAYTGAALANLTLSIATSSTVGPATNGNGNLVGLGVVNIATTTGNFTEASSTASTAVPNTGSTAINNVWAAGSYETFTFNATTTGVCSVGLEYFSS